MELPWVDHTDILARIGREPSLCLQLTQAGEDPRRVALKTSFASASPSITAPVRHFMPCLLGLHGDNGRVQGAVGLRSAASPAVSRTVRTNPSSWPLPAAAAARCRARRSSRSATAAFGSASARLLIVALTDLLVAQGFRWVVFTGTPALLNSFQRLALEPLALAPADPARMGEDTADWGSYYASRPQLMAGEILPGHQRLLQLGIYARLGYQPLFDASEVPHAACS